MTATKGLYQTHKDELELRQRGMLCESSVSVGVVTPRWKYCVDAPEKHGGQHASSDRYVEQYLYDLKADPYELSNLIGLESHRSVANVMRDRLIRRMVEAGEEAPVIEEAEEWKSGQRRIKEGEQYL